MADAERPLLVPGWDLAGRRIAITGAARGLGRALAIVAADHGARPVLLARNAAAAQQVAVSIQARTSERCEVFGCDLGQPASVRAACAAARCRSGRRYPHQQRCATRGAAGGARLTNREVVAAVMFSLCAPRVCAYPRIVLENMSGT